MTKTPQQIKNEVEKEINNLEYLERGEVMYGMNEVNKKEIQKLFKHSLAERNLWEARAKLSILTEYDKAIKEMTENNLLRETAIEDCKWLKENMINVDNDTWIYRKAQWDCLVEFFDLTEQELLSKMGDNSDNSQTELSPCSSSDTQEAQNFQRLKNVLKYILSKIGDNSEVEK
jgi:hypothetical protein